ncbi:MAG: tryptophan synthase subunit alpha [Bacteroidetes bacterium]|nr:tryptophan synthase subunit alpha [Bacteroidota bacterium]
MIKILQLFFALVLIFLITPQTADDRIHFIDEHSDGFIYMVSSASTTGAKEGIGKQQENYFKRIQTMKLKNPLMIGFGISDHETFSKACEYANGAIIGSAFIKAIGNKNKLKENIKQFVGKVIS